MVTPNTDGGPLVGLIVNADSFTRRKQTAEGTLAPGSLERLDEVLFADEGELNYRIQGHAATGADGTEQRRLHLVVSGWVTLQDQTTLQGVRYDLDIESRLVLVRNEAALPPLEAESEDEDFIVVDQELDLAALVEDEVILDLPVFAGTAEQDAAAAEKSGTMPDRPSPFAALAALKKSNS